MFEFLNIYEHHESIVQSPKHKQCHNYGIVIATLLTPVVFRVQSFD